MISPEREKKTAPRVAPLAGPVLSAEELEMTEEERAEEKKKMAVLKKFYRNR
jgi:hypothetical protein